MMSITFFSSGLRLSSELALARLAFFENTSASLSN